MTNFISYAQNFEDVMLWRAFKHVEKGFYIDLGAQDPVVDSVSLAFHERGWRGVHVEPTPHYAQLLRTQRMGDTVIEAAVGNQPGLLKFYEIPETGISTADLQIAEQHRARGYFIQEITVPCVRLSSIFENCGEQEIHWLKIDVEGFEWNALSSWGKSPSRPWIVVVESTIPLTQIESNQRWESLLLRRDYSPIYFDGLNRYYVSKAHDELKKAFSVPPNHFDGFCISGTANNTLPIELMSRHAAALANSQAIWQRADGEIQNLTMQLGEKTTGALHVEQLLRIEIGDLKAEAVRVGALMNAAKAEFAEKLMAAQHEELNAANMRAAREREFLVQAAAQDQLFREEISRMQVELAQTLNALVVAKDKSARELQAKQQLVQESLHALALRERVNAEQIVALVQCHRGELESLRNEFEEQTASQERIHIEQRQASQAELVRLHEQIAENEREYAARFASFQEITGQEKIEWARAATLRGTEFAAQVAAFCSDIRKLELEYQRRESEHEERAEVALRESRSVHTSLEKREQELEAQLSEAKQRAKLELTEQEDFSRRTIGELEKKLATAERVSAELHNNLDLAENKLLLMRESLVWRMTTRLHRVFNKGVFPITNKSLVRRNEVVDQTQTRRSCDQQMLLMNSPAHNFQPWPRSQELNALLSCDDDRFVDNAFKIVLGRSSEPKASAFYLNRLLSGITKMQILNEISESDEAAAYAKRPYHFSGQELMPVQAAKSVDELLSHFDRDFVHVAYQTILGRGADAEGLMHYTVRLRLGAPKIKLLSEMITSQERDVLGKLICEMYAAARCYSRSKMPLLGLFWRRMYDIAGPAVADPEPLHFPEKIKTLSSLMASAKLEFVNCVYRTLLGRNPDVAGAEFYIKRLETGGSRTQLIWEILQSPECNERQILFAKLTSATTLYQLGQAAFIGWFIRKLAHVEGNTLTDVRLRSMESQLFLIAEANRRTPLSRHDLASPQDLFETQAQVDAFSKLSPAARAIYSELKAAAALQT